MRNEMGLESYMLLVPDSQGQGYFCTFCLCICYYMEYT